MQLERGLRSCHKQGTEDSTGCPTSLSKKLKPISFCHCCLLCAGSAQHTQPCWALQTHQAPPGLWDPHPTAPRAVLVQGSVLSPSPAPRKAPVLLFCTHTQLGLSLCVSGLSCPQHSSTPRAGSPPGTGKQKFQQPLSRQCCNSFQNIIHI